jgi:recombination DNA repair RAD52 pathway protein
VVRLSFKDGRFIDGYGKATAEEGDTAHCLKQAKKLAVTDALKSW